MGKARRNLSQGRALFKIAALAVGCLAAAVSPARAGFNFFNTRDTTRYPRLLSQTGVFTDIANKVLDTSAKFFEVNSALWSDGAIKRRWIILRPGQQIPYDDSTDFFDYPDSTVFVKTFLQEKIEGDSGTRYHWETRLWIKLADTSEKHADWHGFSYKWNDAQTEAVLASKSYQGFDTVIAYTTAAGRQTYKKWHFPSQEHCWYCHGKGRVPDTATRQLKFGRAVLGFYPAQLKRPSPLSPGTDQILDLFGRGVFSGTQPNAAQLAKRFKGIHEPIDAGLSADQRFATLDTMARSYIAANCSNCHSDRGRLLGLCSADLDFDFNNLKPLMEFGMRAVEPVGLNDLTAYDSMEQPLGRSQYVFHVSRWGMETGAGKPWDMSLPPGDPQALPSVLVYPGYPALSEILFRQWARNSPHIDSAKVFRALKQNLSPVDYAVIDSALAKERLRFLYASPWGSRAWFDSLAAHGLTADSLIETYSDGYYKEPQQMPTLLTFLPDTAALKLLGEWAKNYRTRVVVDPGHVYSGVKNGKLDPWGAPYFRGRTLFVPKAWTGKASMLDIRGRVHALTPLGRGVFAIPNAIPPGIFLFRVGSHYFKASLF